ncbi:uncharacterized protein LOC127845724 isoform X4 [Dreissena polymorpha]|nr:uncharacterized protein LOC127845724 isoform X2 [Dreissena polymorpha]XP_052232789.1 uncharacterized protein LOC127845724 isoform X3 [Dreissena polymorpha]XP_052232790.1 uncharacterized protein LOC127845724 isoform X4 [Dreissena polymorpha]
MTIKAFVFCLVCLVSPLEGCKDNVTGELIALDTEKEVNCILKRCRKVQGVNVLEIVSGGCKAGGQCVPEGNTTTVFTGEACAKQFCKRQSNDSVATFVLEDLSKGCRDGDACEDIGSEIIRGCYTRQCIVDTTSKEPAFKVTDAACPWLETCVPANSTWSYNCMSYRCDILEAGGNYQRAVVPIEYGCGDGRGNCVKVGDRLKGTCYEAVCSMNDNKTQVSLDVIKGDCEWNGGCYQPNQTWADGCITYQCDVTRTTHDVNWNVKTISVGCKDFKSNCVPENEVISERCVDYMCKKSGDRVGLQAVSVGCTWGEGCKASNSTWTEDERCVQYQCLKKETPKGSVMEISVAGYGCVYNNTCKEVNATWADGCRTRKCVVKIANNMIQRSIDPITAGCDDQGICRPIGYKKVTESCAEYECQFNETYKDAFFTLSSGACKTKTGECKKVDQSWTEKRNDSCLTFQCQAVALGYVSRMTQQSCIDADGVCRPIGSTGFPAMVNNKRQPDCRCELSEAVASSLTIRCSVP